MTETTRLDRRLPHVIAVIIFFTTYFPRQLDLVSITTVWHQRAWIFMNALATGDLAATYQTPHPGVLTMWLAGVARWLAVQRDPAFNDANLADQMTVEMIPLNLVVAASLVMAFYLLGRLFDYHVATVAILLMALDPLHIAVSKTLHGDGHMSTLAMVSALLLLCYLRNDKRRYLLGSAVSAGLAIVTKTPALFLIPYMLLALGVGGVDRHADGWRDWLRPTIWLRALRHIAVPAVLWLAVMAFTYFAVWPSMWIDPFGTFYRSIEGTFFYRGTPHENPLYFLGEVTDNDPGLLFYALTIPLTSTMITLAGFALGCVFLLFGRQTRAQQLSLWLIIAFFVFFTMQMTLGEKKFIRYDLPAVQFYIITAGFGWVAFARIVAQNRRFIWMVSILLVALQALIVLPRHPYYGTHYNRLFGSPQQILESGIVPGQEEGEGLKEAADWLNNLPGAVQLVVGAQNYEGFYRYFNGKVVPLSDDQPDYIVVTRNWIIRGMRDYSWGETWQKYQDRTPKHTVSFDGVPYVWIYKTGELVTADQITHPVNAQFGEAITLLGYDLQPSADTLDLTLFWEAAAAPSSDLTIFMHLLDGVGNLIVQRDSQPESGRYPTYLWSAAERITDPQPITLPADLPPGTYTLVLGAYTLATGEREPLTLADGSTPAERMMTLTTITIP